MQKNRLYGVAAAQAVGVLAVMMIVGCGKGETPSSDPELDHIRRLQKQAYKGGAAEKYDYAMACMGESVILDSDYVETFQLRKVLSEARDLGHPDAKEALLQLQLLVDQGSAWFDACNAADAGDKDAMLAVAMIIVNRPTAWLPKNSSWLGMAQDYTRKADSAGHSGARQLLADISLLKKYTTGGRSGLPVSDLLAGAQDRVTRSSQPMVLMLAEYMAREAQEKNAPAAREILQEIAEARGAL